MAYSYAQLKAMKVAELRKIAAGIEHDAVKGYTQLNKEHLLEALATALNIDRFARRKVPAAAVVDKVAVKAQIRELKLERNAALETGDHDRLKKVRREMHGLRRVLRKIPARK